MSLHKLTAGDGYTYLTRQVAAADSTERGYSSLGDYYAAKGESPGQWYGRGLAGLTVEGHEVTGAVTEQQMRNLFGEGVHPDAQDLAENLTTAGIGAAAAAAATRLGARFPTFEVNTQWSEALAAGYRRFAIDAGYEPNEPLSDGDKQTVRTSVADELFHAKHDRLPVSSAERSGFIAQQSRPDRSAVAGYDLTFSPVKSISTLWAVAPKAISEQVEAAHQAAVTKTLAWIEKEAGYTRVGARSVGQVEARGLIVAMFTHRDSRAGDPDLHTHAALSGKVQTADGRWLALDARMLYRIAVGASEFYNTEIEVEVTQRVGVQFAERAAGNGRRAVREVVGIAAELNEQWSKRRVAIDSARTQLAETFLTQHGRVPTTVEMIKLSARATLATREAKHEPRSLDEQRSAWRAEAVEVLGGAQQLDSMLQEVTGQAPPEPAQVTAGLIVDLAQRVVRTVSEGRATWRQTNLDAEARRQVRGLDVDPGARQYLADRVAEVAAGPEHSVRIGVDPEVDAPVPAELARSDGSSIFRMAKGQLLTSEAILAAEARVLAAAGRTGARTITTGDVEIAQLEWSANHDGAQLNTAQAAMITEVATNDRQVQLALAPAGTGKTTVMGVLARAWMSTGGTVLGLAPQASAAQELGAAIPGADADTIDKLVYDLACTPQAQWTPWMQAIDADSLVVIDEAGLASTPKLDVAIAFITGRGGRVLLVGDDQQRAANGAGGILRDIEATHGALTLTDVMRFTDAVEGQASLALRAGDTSVVGFYADRDRITAVTPDTVADHVFRAWAADVAAGADSVMIAPTIPMVAALNARARAARLDAAGGPVGRELALPNGEMVSAGDVIITKRNRRQLSLGGTDFVRNNHRWTVGEIRPDGTIIATEITRNVTRALPQWYVQAGHVRLGYAHTHASVQGMTVGKAGRRRGTAHAVVTPGMTRNDLYPTLTRAADGTTTYVILGGQGDTHDVTTPGAINPPTAAEVLADIITTDGSARSVTTEQREAADPFRRLGHAADAYAHTVLVGAQTVVGPEVSARLAELADAIVPGVTDAPAWDVLHAHLVVLAADHRDATGDLAAAAEMRELGTARDVAAVLDYRMDPDGNHGQDSGPLPWLPQAPASVTDLPVWDRYLQARSDLVTSLAQEVADTARGWEPDTAPAWAIPYLADQDLVAELAVWRAAESIPETDLRPAGPTPRRIAMVRRHSDMVTRALHVGGGIGDHADRWAEELAASGVTISGDDHWPVLAGRLSLAEAAGVDVPTLLRSATSGAPLPAEGAAGALWWRLAPHVGDLTPATTRGHRLRPPWTSQLETALGGETTARITADRLWPVLVGRVDAATRVGGAPAPRGRGAAPAGAPPPPAQLVRDAAEMLRANRDTLAEHELPTVLLVNLTTLSDPAPADVDDPDEHLLPDPEEADRRAPHDIGAVLLELDDQRSPSRAQASAGHERSAGDAGETVGPNRLDEPAEPSEPTEPDSADPFDLAAHPVPADLLDIPDPHEPEPELDEPDPEPVDELTAEPGNPDAQQITAALTAAQAFYTERAARSWVPQQLADRGLHPTGAGYAPGRNATVQHLRGQGFTDPQILAAGLARTSDRGELYDFFRNRLTLPYTDPSGQVVGFMTRKPAGDTNPANPKYLNSPETVVFSKTDTLYGLDPATATALRDGADVVLVEGPMDAEAINTASGRRGLVAVATGGTALTAGHLASLERVAPLADRQVVVVMDNDTAGDTAAARAYRVLASAGVTHPVTVTPLPVKDPAQLLSEQGPQALRHALADRRPLQDLVVDRILDQHPDAARGPEYRISALDLVSGVIAHMPQDQQLRQVLRVADRTDSSLLMVMDVLDDHRPPLPPYRPDPDGGLGLPTPPRLRSLPDPTPAPAPVGVGAAVATAPVAFHPQVMPQSAPVDPAPVAPSAAAVATQLDERTEQTTPLRREPVHEEPVEDLAAPATPPQPAAPERPGQDLAGAAMADELARMEADRQQTQDAAARAAEQHQQLSAAVSADQGPATQALRATDAAHRERIAAIRLYRAAAEAAQTARAAAITGAVEIADAEAELENLPGHRVGRRRAMLEARLQELRQAQTLREAELAAAAEAAQPLLAAAGHPSTHQAAREAATEHRDALPQLTEQARTADQTAVEVSRVRAEQFAVTAADVAARHNALLAEHGHRTPHPGTPVRDGDELTRRDPDRDAYRREQRHLDRPDLSSHRDLER